MSRLFIATELSPANALRAKSAEAGKLRVYPTEEEMNSLSDEQRKILTEGGYVYHDGSRESRECKYALGVGSPGWAGVVCQVDALIERAVKAQAEADETALAALERALADGSGIDYYGSLRQTAERLRPTALPLLDARIAAYRAQNVAAREAAEAKRLQAVAQAEAEKQAEQDALRALLADTPPEMMVVERWEKKVLPAAELEQLVAQRVFAPMAAHCRRTEETAHERRDVNYNNQPLTAEQYTAWQAVSDSIPEGVTYTLRRYTPEDEGQELYVRLRAQKYGVEVVRDYLVWEE